MSWAKSILIALAYQLIPCAWMMWDLWDSPTTKTHLLWTLVFVAVPIFSGFVHNSKKVALAGFLLPVLAMGVMMGIFALTMGNGR